MRQQRPGDKRRPSPGVFPQRNKEGFSWNGRSFYVQVERAGEAAETGSTSVRHDDEKYAKHAAAVEFGITQYFDGQIQVEVVQVTAHYALEVRVMPVERHPRHGQKYVGKNAELVGGMTIFSKLETKQWPKLEDLIQNIRERCRVPLRISFVAFEMSREVGPAGTLPQHVREAVNGPSNAKPKPVPISKRFSFMCEHSHQLSLEMHTDAEGKASSAVFPGNWRISCDDDCDYDELTPNLMCIPAAFTLQDITVTAAMKKACVFHVVDHMHKPCPRLSLRLTPQEANRNPVTLRTKMDGKCNTRLARGVYIAGYNPEEKEESVRDWPVEPFQEEIQVVQSEIPQFFKINVQRVRFNCELLLRTRFEEPVTSCPFKIKSGNRVVSSGTTTDLGVAMCNVPHGGYTLKLEPESASPFVQVQIPIEVSDNGHYVQVEQKVETRNGDVSFQLVRPDGEAAAGCTFHLVPQFPDAGSGGRKWEITMRSDENGIARANMGFLEPYIFRVKDIGKAMDYMPQEFVFQTDKRSLTVVVARSVFGIIPEEHIVFAIDASGSMQVYLDDIKAALNATLVQQFHKTARKFNVIAFSGGCQMFRPTLVDSTPQNLQDAMRFCDGIEAGGTSGALSVVERAFALPGVQATYMVTDGKCDIGESVLNGVRKLYYAHPDRPRINSIGINCPPKKVAWKGLQAIAGITQATFRPICLEQECIDPLTRLMGSGGRESVVGLNLAPPHPGSSSDEEAYDESGMQDGDDFSDDSL